ncbi:MAG: DJ-1/PfpI family protein [Gammaproteobacteria bacterium]
MKRRWSIGVVLFADFELLDVFGPLEMYGAAPEQFEICMVAQTDGPVPSRQGPKAIADYAFPEKRQYDMLLVPGGMGTRKEVDNPALLNWLRQHAAGAQYVTAVCTGSALLARAGLLDGVRATTNKKSFGWATSQGPKVNWVRQARWVEDGRFFTSSGVSAGMDMALAVIAKLLGPETADTIATWTEYEWHRDAGWDPFAAVHGLVRGDS